MVDTRFAANARIDHRLQRSRNLHKPDAPERRRGHEAGQIADDAATQRHHHVGPLDTVAEQPVVQLRRDGQALAPLPVRHRFPIRRNPGREQRGLEIPTVQLVDRGIGDDPRSPGPGIMLFDKLACEIDRARTDVNIRTTGRCVQDHPRRQHGRANERGDFLRYLIGAHAIDGQRDVGAIVRFQSLFLEGLDPLEWIAPGQHRALGAVANLFGLAQHSFQHLIGVRIERHGQRAGTPEQFIAPGRLINHRATAGRDHDPVPGQRIGQVLALDLAEPAFAAGRVGKDLRDRQTGFNFDVLIVVDRSPAELGREQERDRALARSAESGQNDPFHILHVDLRSVPGSYTGAASRGDHRRE